MSWRRPDGAMRTRDGARWVALSTDQLRQTTRHERSVVQLLMHVVYLARLKRSPQGRGADGPAHCYFLRWRRHEVQTVACRPY